MSTGEALAQSPAVVNSFTPYRAALWYHERGLKPIPWVARGGQKIAAMGKFTYDVYTSDERAVEWVMSEWAYNQDWQVGLALHENMGVFCVDVDDPAQLEAWEAEHGPVQGDTWTQTTGRDGGGQHRLFRSGGRGAAWPKQGKFDNAHAKLEFRSNGLIGVSPSVHPSGRRYQWTADSPAEIATTGWQLNTLIASRAAHKERTVATSSVRASVRPDGTRSYTSDMDTLLLHGIPSGQSQHETLRDLVWNGVCRGLSDVMIRILWDTVVSKTPLTRPDQPWTDAHFERQLSGARDKIGAGAHPDRMQLIAKLHAEKLPSPDTSVADASPAPAEADGPSTFANGRVEGNPLRPISYAELKEYGAHQVGMGSLFADRFCDVFRWCNDENAYYTWFSFHGEHITHWQRETYNAVSPRFVYMVLKMGEVIRECVKQYTNGLDESTADGAKLAKDARAYLVPFQKSETVRGISKIVIADQRLAAVPDDFTAKPNILNFLNGTYDVMTGELYPHRREDMNTMTIQRDLDTSLSGKDLREAAPLFNGMLWRMCGTPEEVDPVTWTHRVDAVKRWLGYQLHGSNPEKKLGVFEGATSIGKNQVVETVGDILSEYAYTSCPPSLLVRSRQDRHSSVEAGLSGKRLVVVNELTKGQVLDEGQVLRLVNPEGARVDLRRMRENAVSTEITWKLTVTTNEMPRTDTTDQIIQRLAFFPLSKVPVPPEDRDPTLKASILKQESDVILAHVVSWWREWWLEHAAGNRNALALPKESEETMSEFVEDNVTPLQEFVEEMCIVGDGGYVDARELWRKAVGYWQDQHPDKRLEYSGGRKELFRVLDGTSGVTRRTRGSSKNLVGFENIRVRSLYGEADRVLQSWADGTGR